MASLAETLRSTYLNTFIDAYLMLTSKSHCETVNRRKWIEDAWLLCVTVERETACSTLPAAALTRAVRPQCCS